MRMRICVHDSNVFAALTQPPPPRPPPRFNWNWKAFENNLENQLLHTDAEWECERNSIMMMKITYETVHIVEYSLQNR